MPKNMELPRDEGDKEKASSPDQSADLWETQYFDKDLSKRPAAQEAIRRAKERQDLKEARREVEKRFEEGESRPADHAVIIKPFKPGSLQEKLYNEKMEEIGKALEEKSAKEQDKEKKPWWKFWG